MHATDTIIKPVITEKATMLSQKMIYVFYVNAKATKVDVKNAVKELYGQDVAKVTMILSPAKKKFFRKNMVNKRSAMKKAVVTLKGKKKLDVTKISKEPKK